MQEWRIDLFRPEDAPGVISLYRSVYGDDYPVKTVYDPDHLCKEMEQGDVYRIVARSATDEVVGHIAFYRSSPPNRPRGTQALHAGESLMKAILCNEYGPIDGLTLADLPEPEATGSKVVISRCAHPIFNSFMIAPGVGFRF